VVKLRGEERRKLKGKGEDLKGRVEEPGMLVIVRMEDLHDKRGRTGEYC
jgi:hypothetical protein